MQSLKEKSTHPVTACTKQQTRSTPQIASRSLSMIKKKIVLRAHRPVSVVTSAAIEQLLTKTPLYLAFKLLLYRQLPFPQGLT